MELPAPLLERMEPLPEEGRPSLRHNLDLQRPLAVGTTTKNGHDHASPPPATTGWPPFGFVGLPQGYTLLNLDRTVFVEYNTANSADYGDSRFTQLIGARDMIRTRGCD